MNKSLICFFFFFLVSYTQSIDEGCLQQNQQRQCIACQQRFYMNTMKKCQKVSILCKDYNHTNGKCLSCLNSFILHQGQCTRHIVVAAQSSTTQTLHCLQMNSTGYCTRCQIGYVLTAKHQCKKISQYCTSYHIKSGMCLMCDSGYQVKNGDCEKELVKPIVTIANCYTMSDSICVMCNQGYELSESNQCLMSVENCRLYDDKRQCIDCMYGYYLLADNKCDLVDTAQQFAQVFHIDPFCAQFKDGQCQKCSWGYYFDEKRTCMPVSHMCKSFNPQNGNCLSCYIGYQLNKGNCQVGVMDYDPNCNRFQGTKCVRCSYGSYMNSEGRCMLSDPMCRSKNTLGQCVECYMGYFLNNQKRCDIDTNFNCNQWSNGICLKCSQGYFMNGDKKCIEIDALCSRFNYNTKQCQTCYSGYLMYQGKCQIASKVPQKYSKFAHNCAQYNKNNECIRCYYFSYLTPEKYCKDVDPMCRTYNRFNGNCTSCYFGYKLYSNGMCMLKRR